MGDLIDRQAAIDAMADMYHTAERWGEEATDGVIKARAESCMASLVEMKLRIEKLPSAEPEIVRCRECKYCEHWYADRGRCFLWHEDGISVFEDGFCNYAERKTDDDGRDQSADTSQSAG